MPNHNRRKRNKRFICVDCSTNVSTLKEHYFVHTNLWVNVARYTIHEMACIPCLTKRIGRELNRLDFTDASINNPKHNDMSPNLLAALSR